MDKLYLDELKKLNEIKLKFPKTGEKKPGVVPMLKKFFKKKEKKPENRGLSKTTEVLVAADTILGVASLVYTAILRGKSETCKRTTDNIEQYETCMARFKIKALEESKAALSNKISFCYKTNDPEKCQEKVANKINRIEAVINDLKERNNL